MLHQKGDEEFADLGVLRKAKLGGFVENVVVVWGAAERVDEKGGHVLQHKPVVV